MNNANCSQTCTNTNGSYLCSCNSGYTLNADNRTCHGWSDSTLASLRLIHVPITDNDECLNSKGGCTQNCTNTDGGYFCSCIPGYQLGFDNMTCNGR